MSERTSGWDNAWETGHIFRSKGLIRTQPKTKAAQYLLLLLLLLLLLSHFSPVWLCATPSLGFSRQEHWSGLPFPSPMQESEKWKWSRSVMSDSSQPHGLQPTRLLRPWDFPGKSTGVGCHCLLHQYPQRDIISEESPLEGEDGKHLWLSTDPHL